jgi:D-alanyl-D-alanine carboxypeptidase (penicillin-binding protein 5/6)
MHRLPRHTPLHSIGKTIAVAELFAVAWLACTFALVALLPQYAYAVVRESDRYDGFSGSELKVPKDARMDVTMKAGALVTEDGRTLWTRSAEDRRAMASITKIMTAVVAIENTKQGERIPITAEAARVGESTSFLRVGESLPLSDVLEALLVKSGNDAAVALSQHVAGGEAEFVRLMNRKAADLGLKHTHFSNPHGLDERGHYSSAADLAVLSRYAMTLPQFRKVVGKKTARIGKGRRAETVVSTNLLLGNYTGANGVKTGWTNDAGYSVVASARRDGIELYAVTLGTKSEMRRFKDAREVLDFGFAHFRPQRLVSAGTVIGAAPVSDYLDVTVPAAVATDTTVPVYDLLGPITRSVTVAPVKAPVMKGQRVGVATFAQKGNIVASVPLVAVQAVEPPNVFERVWIAVVRAWRAVAGTAPK